jgi:hypothetical protein
MYLDATAASVLPAVFGWGWGALSGWPILSLSLAFACVPFLLGRAGRFDALLAAFLVTLPLSFLAWGFHGLHGYGPRFYFEAFLGLYLLTSRGIFLLAGIDAASRPVRFRHGKVVAGAAIGLFAVATLSTVTTLRPRLQLYSGYNWVDGSLERAIEQQGLKKAVILFSNPDWFPWGAASGLLKADLHADIAFAVSRPSNETLFAFYPDRPVYVWDGGKLSLQARMSSSGGPMSLSSPMSAGRVTTLLAWWLGISAVGGGAIALLSRGRRAVLEYRSAARRSVEPVSPELQSDESSRKESIPIPFVHPIRAMIGVLVVYVGQVLFTPGRLMPWFSAFGLTERALFHAGWLLLLVGAAFFGAAWPGVIPVARSQPVEAQEHSPTRGGGAASG